jgi:replicative superfamily II helicase
MSLYIAFSRIEKSFQSKQLESKLCRTHWQASISDCLLTAPYSVELAAVGIGAHHAGLEFSDKRLVEELFLNRILRVVVATSVSWIVA